VSTPGRSAWRHGFLWIPPILYAVLIFHLSSESDPLPQLTSLVWDKALHVIEYGIFALLLCRALRGGGLGWRVCLPLAVLIASAYSASDEWHQLFVPGRDADTMDWAADTIASVVAATGYRSIATRVAVRSPSSQVQFKR
jgi:VanZ family protein